MYNSTEILKNDTVGDLLEFLDDAIENGQYSASSIVPLKIAVRKVMRETEGASSNWEMVPLNEVDLDKRMDSFRDTVDSCSESTIRTYKTRFERAIKLHLAEARKSQRRREAFELYYQRPTHIEFDRLANPNEVGRVENDLLFNKVNPNERSNVAAAVQNEYILHLKKELIRFINATNFEKMNTVFPIDLNNDDAFLILPKNISRDGEELLLEKIRLFLERNS